MEVQHDQDALRWLDWIFWGSYLPSLSINYKKNYRAVFWKNAKFLGMDQITSKNKSSRMQVNKILLTRDRPEQFPSFFCMQFSMESNHYEKKPCS